MFIRYKRSPGCAVSSSQSVSMDCRQNILGRRFDVKSLSGDDQTAAGGGDNVETFISSFHLLQPKIVLWMM